MTTGILQLSKKFLHDRIIPFNLKIAGKILKHMKSNSNTYAVEIGLQFANYYVSPSSLSKKNKKKWKYSNKFYPDDGQIFISARDMQFKNKTSLIQRQWKKSLLIIKSFDCEMHWLRNGYQSKTITKMFQIQVIPVNIISIRTLSFLLAA